MSVNINKRVDAIVRIQADTTPRVRALIIDRLIELLEVHSDAASTCASDYLVRFGEIALSALSHKLLNSPDSTTVQRIALILGTIGAKAPPYSQVSIQNTLDIRLAQARDTDVAKAILEAMEKIRPGSAALIAFTMT